MGKPVRRNGSAAIGVIISRTTGAINTTECCVACAVAVACVGLCCGSTHDFIVAQQSQLGALTVRMLMPQLCAGAWKDTTSSASTSRTAVISRFITPLLAQPIRAVDVG
jgi:hypothetical protein